MSFAKRFIGAENLPTRLSEFDVQQSFCLSADDIAAVTERFRHDRRVAAAIQMLFLRASGRPRGPIRVRSEDTTALRVRRVSILRREHRQPAVPVRTPSDAI